MKEDENNLFELMREAQGGNQRAMLAIVQQFYPFISKVRRKVNRQDQEDFEQELLEKITRATLMYDLNTPIDITHFKNSIHGFVNKSRK